MLSKVNLVSVCVFALVLLFFPVRLSADDSGSWLTLQANKSFDKSYAFLRLEHRSFNDFSDTEAMFLSAGAGYKFAPWFNADLSYELWDVNPGVTIHKAVLATTATMVREGLVVSIKEKLEYAMVPAAESTSLTLRSRLRAQYRFPDSAFRPYAMAETFNSSSWVRSLYYVGTEIAIDRHSVLDLYYLYHVPAGAEQVHVIGAGYFFNF